ncbi:MAG: TolC family outer membrane protein [Alphaproteobacteria bacterium]|nr:TolC family outer membrane protein [Alphaproteobacteria bacterium]
MLFASVCALALVPAPAFSENLEETLSLTYTSNPELLAERARQRATDEAVSQAVSGWRPSVTVQGTYGSVDTESTVPPLATTSTRTEPWTGTVTATQPIFQGGRVLAQTRQARAQVRAGRAQLLSIEQSVLLDSVTAYMDVVRDLAVVNLNRNQIEVLKRQLQAAQDRFDVGEITRTDVAQAEARLSRSQSALTAAEATLTQSRAAYERTVGQAPGTLDPQPPVPALPSSEEEALALAHTSNPALTAARENEEASSHAIDRAVGGLLPTLSVDAQYTENEERAAPGSDGNTTSVVGTLTVPLYQGGEEYSFIREAKATNSQLRQVLAQTERQVSEQVRNAWESLRSARASLVSDRAQVSANEIALEGVRQEADVGSRTTLDVLDAEQELLDSRSALVRSERNEIVAAYALLAAIGGLTAEGLGLPVTVYDPSVNYDDVAGRWIGFGSDD